MSTIRKSLSALLVAGSLVVVSCPALAADVIFSGAMTGRGVVTANAGCAPIPFQGVISGGVGTSVFGNFAYSHTVCTSGQGGGPIVGNYVVDFGIDQFIGTLVGDATPSTTVPGTSNIFLSYLITGGTGRFAGATGAFSGIGTADARVRPSIVTYNFAAVPEPSTWAMMLLGFGVIGAGLRRRRRLAVTPQMA